MFPCLEGGGVADARGARCIPALPSVVGLVVVYLLCLYVLCSFVGVCVYLVCLIICYLVLYVVLCLYLLFNSERACLLQAACAGSQRQSVRESK